MYESGDFRARSDLQDFKTLKKALELQNKGRGFVGEMNELLKNNGMKLMASFLWRSPLIDSPKLLSGGDRLHQDHLGGCQKVQKFLIMDRAPFGSKEKKAVVNYWLSIWRANGVAGLVNDNSLFTKGNMQGKERRTLAEITPYLCQLFPVDPTLR